MSNKNKKLGLGIAAVAVAGAGLVYAAQKTSQQKVKKIAKAAPPVDYRNTERGKYEKNSKGIYYTNGNYEAFALLRKPEGVDDKMHTLSEADLQHSQRLVSLSETVRCRVPIFIF